MDQRMIRRRTFKGEFPNVTRAATLARASCGMHGEKRLLVFGTFETC
jgi:hypothetical protein